MGDKAGFYLKLAASLVIGGYVAPMLVNTYLLDNLVMEGQVSQQAAENIKPLLNIGGLYLGAVYMLGWNPMRWQSRFNSQLFMCGLDSAIDGMNLGAHPSLPGM